MRSKLDIKRSEICLLLPNRMEKTKDTEGCPLRCERAIKKIFSGKCLRDLHPSFNRVEDIHITKWKIAHLFYVRFQ